MTTKLARLGPSFSDEMEDEYKLHPPRVRDRAGNITTLGFGDGVSWNGKEYSCNDDVSQVYIDRLAEMVLLHDHTKPRRPNERELALSRIKAQKAKMRAQTTTERKAEHDSADFDTMLDDLDNLMGM